MPPQSPYRKIIAVDMDEVLADALQAHLDRYNRDFATGAQSPITIDDLRGRRLWQVIPPHHHALLDDYLRHEDFFRNLRVMPHAQRVLERLQSRYEVFIASAAMEVPSSFAAKYDWLAEHFPFIPTSHIVFCGNKSILRADYLIDDNPRQLALFEDRQNQTPDATTNPTIPREGILYTSPSNCTITTYRRVDDWLSVEKMFLD
jgi:5'(3')-deoxyribonucleotidase